jgi:thymidylate synthase ThyX
VHTDRVRADVRARGVVDIVNANIRAAYRSLLELGLPAEDARGILPTNIATNICAKFNLRTLSELVQSRSGGRTQAEYRNVIDAMADAVLAVHPWAEPFLFRHGRNYFAELEAFAEAEYGGDLLKKGRLLKIVDAMRKERQL